MAHRAGRDRVQAIAAFEGKPATQRTEVRFAYDDVAIYVGARMFDSMGARGVRTRLLRRDAMTENDSDILEPIGDSRFSRDRSALFSAHPDNIFLVKATYWIAF